MYAQPRGSVQEAAGNLIPSGRRKRKAAALVEFAMVAPIMFLFIFAIFEFGRSFMVMELITEGARIGCRTGIIEGTSQAQVQNAVINYLTGVGINGETVSVIVNQPDPNEMTVTVQVPVSSVSWIPNPLFIKGSLTGQFTLTQE
jgi:Flp pilus assembly protein TadG